MSKIVLFMFAGREENMRVQMPYLHRLLDMYPEMEVHLWDLTRRRSDAAYIRRIAVHERMMVLDSLHPGHPIKCAYPNGMRRPRGWRRCDCIIHKPPYEQPYGYYAEHDQYRDSDTIYVKIDDDVLFLETERFSHLLHPLRSHPERIISAQVINNAVCAKYGEHAAEIANHFAVGDPTNPKNDKRWWALHTLPDFADWCHNKFLDAVPTSLDWDQPAYVRTRPGEAVSINCIAFTQATMERLAPMMDDRLGDEGAVDRLLPWICNGFRAAHLTFGPQDAAITPGVLDIWRKRYEDLAKEYLS